MGVKGASLSRLPWSVAVAQKTGIPKWLSLVSGLPLQFHFEPQPRGRIFLRVTGPRKVDRVLPLDSQLQRNLRLLSPRFARLELKRSRPTDGPLGKSKRRSSGLHPRPGENWWLHISTKPLEVLVWGWWTVGACGMPS